MKRANKSGAAVALILGEAEFAEKSITVKPMHGGEQQTVQWSELNKVLLGILT